MAARPEIGSMKHSHKAVPDRRSFLTRVTGLSALAFLAPLGDRIGLQAEQPGFDAGTSEWDLSWLKTLKGKHRQVFDFGSLEGGEPLRVVRNYLNAHKEVFGLEFPRVNAIVGIASNAFPLNASDALWAKYSLGQRWKVKDPATGTWAVKNVFADPAEPFNDKASGVPAMRKRGVIFWQCNNALNGLVEAFASSMKLEIGDVRSELVAGLMPGVKLVPAHTMLIGLAQEHDFTYEKI